MAPSVGAAAAASALFFVCLLGAVASFRRTKFRVYLLLGLSCAMRGIGYAVRAANISSYSDAKAGTYLALASAGYGISLAVICLLLGCWWKNSDAGAALRKMSVYSRVLIGPVIVFGPVSGAVLASLIYGDKSPGALSAAGQLRMAAVWGMFAVLVVLALDSLWATFLALRGSKGSTRRPRDDADMLALVMVGCCSLLLISASFRLAAVYHHGLGDDDDVFYPVQVLPELLEVLLLLWPKLMPRAALGRGFQRWWDATHGGAGGLGAGAVVAPEGSKLGGESSGQGSAGDFKASKSGVQLDDTVV